MYELKKNLILDTFAHFAFKCQITPAGVEKLPSQAKDVKLGAFQSKCSNCLGRGYITTTPAFNEEKFKKLVEILKVPIFFEIF